LGNKHSDRLTPRKWAKLMLRQPPRELYGQPAVYLSGSVMEIEHFKRIVFYNEDKLCVEMRGGRFTVYGSELKIRTLTAHRITLCGKFLRTDWADS